MNYKQRLLSIFLACMLFFNGIFSFNKVKALSYFTDLPETHWAFNAVTALVDQGFINGYEDSTFRPEIKITRAEFATMIMAGILKGNDIDPKSLPYYGSFYDVNENDWFRPYVEYAAGSGIVNGTGGGMFSPNDLITREQMTTMAINLYCMVTGTSVYNISVPTTTHFLDENEINNYALKPVLIAQSKSIIKGMPGNKFEPQGTSTRAMAAQVLYNLFNVFDAELNPTPTPVPTLPPDGFNFQIKDSVMDPVKPVVYMIDAENKKLHTYNLESKELQDLSFDYTPVSLTMENNEVYVAFIVSPNLGQAGTGAIAVVDPDNMVIKSQFEINMIPFDIVADGKGYIYVTSGNYQLASFKSYSLTTKQQLYAIEPIQENSYIAINNSKNKIYISNSLDTTVCGIDNGMIIGTSRKIQDSKPYGPIKISPDDKYLFSSSWFYYTCAGNVADNIILSGKLDNNMTAITFDLQNNRFFTSLDKTVTEYDYTSKNVINSYTCPDDITDIYYKGDKVYALLKNKYNASYFVTLDVGAGTNTATPNPAPSPTAYLNLGFIAAETVMDPTEPIIYFADSVGCKVHSYNYQTGELKETQLDYGPNNIAFANNKIFVTMKKPYTTKQKGAVAVLNASTLEVSAEFDIDCDPFDMIADNSGYVYITNSVGQWGPIYCYSATTKAKIFSVGNFRERSFIRLNPVNNRIYTVDDLGNELSSYALLYNAANSPYLYGPVRAPDPDSHAITPIQKISPDGKYLFDSCSAIRNCSEDKTVDMTFYNSIKITFDDIVFDLINNSFYTGKDNMITKCDYTSLAKLETYNTKNKIKFLQCQNNLVFAITEDTYSNCYLETLNP